MTKLQSRLLKFISLINILEGIVVFVIMLLTPSEGKNNLVGGYSFQKLIILISVLAFLIFLTGLNWALFKDLKWGQFYKRLYQDSKKSVYVFWLSLFLGIILFNLLLIPDYLLGNTIYLFARLRPVILWGGLFFIQAILPLLIPFINSHFIDIKASIKTYRPILILALLILIGFLLLWGWMAWSGMGIFPDVTFWNDPGVPLLIIQVYIAVAIGAGLFLFERRIKKQNKKFPVKADWFLCVFIFLAAATLWNLTPQKSTVFAPGPYPPTSDFFPHSDAQGYNISAQRALVGSNYYSDLGCPDKALYITFLTWLNYFAGLHQNLVIMLQVIVFSILPVIIYQIGKQLNNRPTAMIAAFLAIFKESNAIGSASIISTTMSKMMMTELPTAIFIALFILFFILWIKNKGQSYYLAGILGGLIGLSTMVRLTMYIFVPLTFLIFGIVLFKKWKNLAIHFGLFTLVLVASILPWEVRVQIVCQPNKPFAYALGPLDGVIWNHRYHLATETPVPNLAATGTQPAPFVRPTVTVVGPLISSTDVGPSVQITPTPSGFKNDQQKNLTSPIKPPGKPYVDKGWALLGDLGDKLNFISNHFFHNLLATVLIFPTTLSHDDLQHIANPLDSFWADNWNGKTGLLPGLLLLLNLGLIALGIAFAWKKYKLAGCIPIIVYLSFCFALGIARTSGGRYIVPIDWILYLYYAGGIVTLINWTGEYLDGERYPVSFDSGLIYAEKTNKKQTVLTGVVLAVFLGLGLMVPGTEKVFPALKSTPPATQTIKQDLIAGGYGDKVDIPSKLIVWSGRAINPRYFFYKQDINPGGSVGFPLRYQRFVFTLVGYDLPTINVVLPLKTIPDNVINGTIVSVAGCGNVHNFIDAVMVIINDKIYYRDPRAESLQCPIKELVCNDDSRTCK